MDYKYIEQLLDRYFQCETSLEEESILRTFFAQHDVPAHLLAYKDMFLAMKADEEHLSADFDERILSIISDEADKEEKAIPVVKAKTIRLSYQLRPFFKAAAVVAIILSFSLAVQQAMYSSQDQSGVSYGPATNVVPAAPETALEQTGIVARPDSLAQLSSEVQSAPELLPQ